MNHTWYIRTEQAMKKKSKNYSKVDQLVCKISCRVLDGFKRGWLCCVHNVVAEGKSCITFDVMSKISSARDRKIRIKHQNRVFANIFNRIRGKKHCRKKNNMCSPRSSSITCVCRMTATNSFVLWRKCAFTATVIAV